MLKFIKKHHLIIFTTLPISLWLLAVNIENITYIYIVLFILILVLILSIITFPKYKKPKSKIYLYIILVLGAASFFYTRFVM